MQSRKTLALGALLALLMAGTARADDTYRITAGGDQNWGPKTGAIDQTAPTQLEATGRMTDTGPAVGKADYSLQAGPGLAHVSLHGDVTVPSCAGAPGTPSARAVSTSPFGAARARPSSTATAPRWLRSTHRTTT